MIFSPFGITCLWKCLYPLTVFFLPFLFLFFFLPFLFLFLLLFFFLFSHLIHGRVTNPAKLKLREKKRTKKTGKKIMEESKTRKETSCNNNTVWNECRRKRIKEPRNFSYNKIRILIS